MRFIFRAIPYDFEAYRQVSLKFYDILSSYTLQIEAVSCDEALLDITSVVANTGLSPSCVVEHMRRRIKQDTGCDASAGKQYKAKMSVAQCSVTVWNLTICAISFVVANFRFPKKFWDEENDQKRKEN